MIVILSCVFSLCNNDVMCVEVVKGYKCNCKLGFIGVNCDIEEDECVLSLCIKGFFCVDKVGD